MARIYDFAKIQKAKEAFFSSEEIKIELRPELLESWSRTKSALPDALKISYAPPATISGDSTILELLRLPLNRFAETIEDTGLALLLSDENGRILGRWCSNHSILKILDKIGTSEGASLAEGHVGTNGVGTIIQNNKPFLVQGSEHVAELYSSSACAGAPVWHPITGKLLGVVTLTCSLNQQGELLMPLLKSVITQCEIHLMNVTELKSTSTFNNFLNLNQVFAGPIVAFGPHDMRIQNTKADKLSAEDMFLIRQSISEKSGADSFSLDLSFGEAIIQVNDAAKGYPLARIIEQSRPNQSGINEAPANSPLTHARLAGRSSIWLSSTKDIQVQRALPRPLIVAGENGVGKLSMAMGYPIDSDAILPSNIVQSAEVHLLGLNEWLKKLSLVLKSHPTVAVSGIQALPSEAREGLRSLLKARQNECKVYLTLTCAEQANAIEAANFFGVTHVWVPSLRDRISDICLLWGAFASLDQVHASMKLSDEVIQVLHTHPWSGNLTELKNVVMTLKAEGKNGLISVQDLPKGIKHQGRLSMIDRVEADAIRQALEEADGNRQKAADILGLSRATIYRKMRTYHIDEKTS